MAQATAAPKFYTPEAETAEVVRCGSDHLLSQEVALIVGEQVHSRWACPYCIYTDRERLIAMRAYEVGVDHGRAKDSK